MAKHSEVFVKLDVAKAKNAVAFAEGGRHVGKELVFVKIAGFYLSLVLDGEPVW